MEQPKSEPPEEIASPSSELDTVFETFFQKIEELPPIPKPRSAKDYLETNRAKIIHALSKGYTYEQLAALLNECGFSISASTLRRYIGPVKGRKGDELTQDLIPDATTDVEKLDSTDNSQPAATVDYKPSLRPRRK
jgi:DNA-binding transcriptional ArsR family regulator